MPSFPDLDRLLLKATFFAGLNARLASLPSLQRVIDHQLDDGRRQEVERLRQEHKQLGPLLHPDDRRYELSDLEQQVTHLLPKLFRGGYVLTLWSVLERSTKDISVKAGLYVGRPISADLFRRKPFFLAAEEALLSRAGVRAFPDQDVRAKLELLASVRQTLVHHDGRIAEAPSNLRTLDRTQLEVLGLQVERDIDFEYVVPSEAYLTASTSLVVNFVHDVADRVFNALVPDNAGDI